MDEDADPYYEWIIPCPVEVIDQTSHAVYFVSRAYYSHYVFVFSRHFDTKQIFLENISCNISVMIESEQNDEEIPEIHLLNHLLETTYPTDDEDAMSIDSPDVND